MRVTLRLNYELNRELQVDSDLSHQDFHILNALADSPGQRLQLTDLAVRIGWERSRVSHQVLRMEARGLVERRPSGADARATDAVLTPAGARRAAPGRTGPRRLGQAAIFRRARSQPARAAAPGAGPDPRVDPGPRHASPARQAPGPLDRRRRRRQLNQRGQSGAGACLWFS
jgi:DNA-binding MarR family transcriptional regulator